MTARKPRVLMLTPWTPFPLDAGSRRIWTACRYLKDRYDFSLLTFFNPNASYSGVAGGDIDPVFNTAAYLRDERRYLGGVFAKVQTVPSSHEAGAPRLEGLALPEDVRRFQSLAMREKILEVIAREAIDLVHVEFDLMAPYVYGIKAAFPNLPCLLTQHDMGTISLFGSYFREMADWRRFLRLGQWWRRLVFTKRVCARFDGVVVLTAPDKRRLAMLIGSGGIHVVPTGVDLEHFAGAASRRDREPDTLVYVGHYPHYPNEDAVLWFSREILPLIWKRSPSVKFYVVGSGPTAAIQELAAREPRIVVTGTVEDVKTYEGKAMAMVAPVRLGKGIKGKLLEGFAMGTPVVATSCANEGVRAAHGRDILVADSPRGFADSALRLLEDAALWEKISKNARAFVGASHDWARRAEQLDAVYAQALRQAGRGPRVMAGSERAIRSS